MAIEQEADH